MASQKITFLNDQGQKLAARIEFPVNQHPHTFALFAHCFTCTKNLTAIRNLSRALNQEGIAVMRFDFTGLGESEGDFADTDFSSNVQDLIAAAKFLEANYQPPEILIGHSLGGAAVIVAASKLESVTAVATIGAPYDPEHVTHLLRTSLEDIEKKGVAEVQIEGRAFSVKKEFLEDIRSYNLKGKLRNLGKALLVLHSPQDMVVEIGNAAKMYKAARHPKSFVSLDGADHLLSRKEDSHYAGEIIATWAKRYISIPKKEALQAYREVAVRLGKEGFTTEIMVRHHSLTADEPVAAGGNDYGPSPYELLSAGLGACTAMTLQMYARRKNWDLREVTVHLEHFKDYVQDREHALEENTKIDHFDRVLELEGNLTETQKQSLVEIAEKCPVHRTLEGEISIRTSLRE